VKFPSEANEALLPFFLDRNDAMIRWGSIVSSFQLLPGLRGFWPMSAIGASGEAIDLSGLGNHLTNTNSADYGSDTLAPIARYNGSSQYHTITDAASSNAFDILGDEGYVITADRGLTVGAWVKFDGAAGGSEETVIGKYTSGDPAYLIQRVNTSGVMQFLIDSGGSDTINSDTAVTTAWTFVVGRYIPSTSIDIFLNGVSDGQNTTSIPATIDNSAVAFRIGATGAPGDYLDGEISCAFICASALSDDLILALNEQSRVIFGV